MEITPDVITIVGWVFGGIGVVLLGFEVWGDRARGRVRCRRCWYDMRDAPEHDGGWTCPECGKVAARERQLRRTRRRWRVVAIAVVLMGTPGGLYAGRVAQEEGWASLLPDWVLVRMPMDLKYGVTAGAWSSELVTFDQPEPTSIEGVMCRRLPGMDPADRRHLLGRIRRHVNTGIYDPGAPGCSIRAYDVLDLIEPSARVLQRYRHMTHGSCSAPPRAMSDAERLEQARRDRTRTLVRLIEEIGNVDGREPLLHTDVLDGVLIAAADDTGHERVHGLLDGLRTLPGAMQLTERRTLAWFDVSLLADQTEPFDSYGFWGADRVESVILEVLCPENEFQTMRELPALVVCGDAMAVAASELDIANTERLVAALGEPRDGLVVALDGSPANTVTFVGVRPVIGALRRRGGAESGDTDSCILEGIVAHLNGVVLDEVELGEDAGSWPYLTVYGGYLVLRSPVDLEGELREELGRIERGEVELGL